MVFLNKLNAGPLAPLLEAYLSISSNIGFGGIWLIFLSGFRGQHGVVRAGGLGRKITVDGVAFGLIAFGYIMDFSRFYVGIAIFGADGSILGLFFYLKGREKKSLSYGLLLCFLIPRPLAAGSFRLIRVKGLPWGLIPFILVAVFLNISIY